jgi:hypothetical protein
MRIDPPVSEPIPMKQLPAATAAPEPPEEPPGIRPVSHGLRLSGVTMPKANSWVCVLPRTTAPAARSCATLAESLSAIQLARTLELDVVGWPAMS